MAETETFKCPYCGTAGGGIKDVHTKCIVCERRRLHEYNNFNGKKYLVLYKKDHTKEIIR